jgi:hypothetical protein
VWETGTTNIAIATNNTQASLFFIKLSSIEWIWSRASRTSLKVIEKASVHSERVNLLRMRSTADSQRFVRQALDASFLRRSVISGANRRLEVLVFFGFCKSTVTQ